MLRSVYTIGHTAQTEMCVDFKSERRGTENISQCSQSERSCTENLFREHFAGVVYREHIYEWALYEPVIILHLDHLETTGFSKMKITQSYSTRIMKRVALNAVIMHSKCDVFNCLCLTFILQKFKSCVHYVLYFLSSLQYTLHEKLEYSFKDLVCTCALKTDKETTNQSLPEVILLMIHRITVNFLSILLFSSANT